MLGELKNVVVETIIVINKINKRYRLTIKESLPIYRII